MKQVTEKFTEKLKQHKKLVANMFRTEDQDMVIPVTKTGEELALAYAECRCEKCKKEDELQFHHLIQRYTKSFINYWKYISQRHYWANIVILCRKHHQEIENRFEPNDNSGTISKETINKIKEEYGIE